MGNPLKQVISLPADMLEKMGAVSEAANSLKAQIASMRREIRAAQEDGRTLSNEFYKKFEDINKKRDELVKSLKGDTRVAAAERGIAKVLKSGDITKIAPALQSLGQIARGGISYRNVSQLGEWIEGAGVSIFKNAARGSFAKLAGKSIASLGGSMMRVGGAAGVAGAGVGGGLMALTEREKNRDVANVAAAQRYGRLNELFMAQKFTPGYRQEEQVKVGSDIAVKRALEARRTSSAYHAIKTFLLGPNAEDIAFANSAASADTIRRNRQMQWGAEYMRSTSVDEIKKQFGTQIENEYMERGMGKYVRKNLQAFFASPILDALLGGGDAPGSNSFTSWLEKKIIPFWFGNKEQRAEEGAIKLQKKLMDAKEAEALAEEEKFRDPQYKIARQDMANKLRAVEKWDHERFSQWSPY